MIAREDAEWALELCARIAAHTDVPGTITRTFLSPATREVQELLRAEMVGLRMSVRLDGAGNLRGVYAGSSLEGQTLLFGSHLDTVPDAGAYDGLLGVAIPLALLRALRGARLGYAVEVIAFSEEEGVRFRLPLIGSRAVVGTLTAEDLARTDADGVSIAEALRGFGLCGSGDGVGQAVEEVRGGTDGVPQGLKPDGFRGSYGTAEAVPLSKTSASEACDGTRFHLMDAGLTPGTFAFLECHIEQGPELEAEGVALGVVETIVGQARYELRFVGKANHAGTTPMRLRQDALAAAAWFISAAERVARENARLVATVGMIEASPGAINIIPGRVVCSLDIRHASDAVRERMAEGLFDEVKGECARRGVEFEVRKTSEQASVAMDVGLIAGLEEAAEAAGYAARRMNSGAGHDAMILGKVLPGAMLFVRTPGGVSHHPSEAVKVEDVQAAMETCGRFLAGLRVP